MSTQQSDERRVLQERVAAVIASDSYRYPAGTVYDNHRAMARKILALVDNDASDFVESLRVHVDTDPNSTCPDGCGWFNYAAKKLRERA